MPHFVLHLQTEGAVCVTAGFLGVQSPAFPKGPSRTKKYYGERILVRAVDSVRAHKCLFFLGKRGRKTVQKVKTT